MSALTVNFNSVINLSDEQFFQLCQQNELIQFERNADGTLVLMPLVYWPNSPSITTGGESILYRMAN
jgi:Uma2 family endonuclease